MIPAARSTGATRRRFRTAAGFRRLWRRARALDRDLRLIAAILLIVAGALGACLTTIREVERHLLKTAATGAAVHWAEFLQAHLRGLDEILAAGLVSEDDQRIFEFAGAAGEVRDYQVIRPDGLVALSNWSGDLRSGTDVATLRSVIEQNRTVALVVTENFAGQRAVVGQAYVPLSSAAGNRGALKIDVDMTGQAQRYRRLGNSAFAALIALLLPPGGLAGWLIGRNLLAQRRAERLQRQRGLVLEALARGTDLDRVLLRMARFIERHRPGSQCSILTLDASGERVASVVSPRRSAREAALAGRHIDKLPEAYAQALASDGAALRPNRRGGSLWSVPLNATAGRPLGCLLLAFPGAAAAKIPDPEGPEASLAQLAAFAIESRRAENALAEMRQRNELILGAAADGIFGVDAEGRVTFANPAATRLLGLPLDQMTGRFAEDLLRAPGRRGEPLPIGPTLADGQPRLLERAEVARRDGKQLSVKIAVTPIPRRLSSLRAVVVFHDISAQIEAQHSLRRAAEEAEAASRSKSNFLAHMSHELRTPLNAIIGFSEVMSAETLGPMNHPNYHEYARHILTSGQHLLSLINDLLDLSKIEAGKLELWEETVDLGKLIERCRVFVAEAAENKGVTLALRAAPDLPDLRCDARKLKQVLVNLLSNAVKFTPPGGRIRLEAAADNRDGVVIQVADTGIGIAAEHIEKVMSPFGQVHEASNRDTQGTGLGLPLSKALVELHGGRLFLDSLPGKGTTAVVQLPGRAVPPQGGSKPAAAAAAG